MLRVTLLLVLLAAAGCGNANYAPVSGTIRVDGQPYPHAVVSFQPIGTTENPNPGRGSSAYTDESGRYVLYSDNEIDGAVIGKHRVRIMTRGNDIVGQNPSGTSVDGAPAEKRVDPIPPEWNALSDKEFEVPAGGVNNADFDIVTKR